MIEVSRQSNQDTPGMIVAAFYPRSTSACGWNHDTRDLTLVGKAARYDTCPSDTFFCLLCNYNSHAIVTMRISLRQRTGRSVHRRRQSVPRLPGPGFDIDHRRPGRSSATKGDRSGLLYQNCHRGPGVLSPIRPLIDWLDYNGYTMVTKPTKEFTDAMGAARSRATWTSSSPSTWLEMAEHLDHVILFSGDGDFVDWSRPCSARACGFRWSARSSLRRRWRTSCGARRTIYRAVRAGAADRLYTIRGSRLGPRAERRMPRARSIRARPTTAARPEAQAMIRPDGGPSVAATRFDEPALDCPLCPRLVSFRT